MKRQSLILLCLLVAHIGIGQTVDTLWMGGPREPILYYWDSNWVDCYLNKLTFVMVCDAAPNKTISVRPCLLSKDRDSLVIIGAAVAAEISDNLTSVRDTSVEGMVPEYLIFYEDQGPLDMQEIARTRYDTCTHVRHRMELHHQSGGSSFYYYPQLREAYLESPIVVRDSFYLGVTQNNRAQVYNPDGSSFLDHRGYKTYWAGPIISFPYDSTYYHHPPYYKRRAQIPVPPNNYVDTLWQRIDATFWLVVFPIYDTTGYHLTIDIIPQDEHCDTVTGLHVMEQDEESLTLAWNTDGHTRWEVAYAPEGDSPEQGDMLDVTAPFACISDCDTGVQYRAYVRTVCDSAHRSHWSTGIPFTLHGAGSGGQSGVAGADIDDLTWMMPNPASGQTHVVSSYHIREVVVYAADGRQVLRQPVYALQATLDLSALPQGVYMVVVRTAYGDTTRKLVVTK